ncbi:hypothetical protein BDA99DRAFT_522901 [Phascolomyces articulosus]|uniref:Uncharacterized protein n=1 Tax=Phascolomyces articulosus TaxID=60185 RepID=A0AAD5K1F6_9FUNG|nr:hypothetical protein BDA99DRAFT_522901 [Phascolomyces articulosus]
MTQQQNGLFYRRFTAQAEPSLPIIRDAAGSDFKRLIEKSRNKDSTTTNNTIDITNEQQQQHSSPPIRPHGFAVGEPIILPLPPNYKRPAPGVLDKVYDWLFSHEDRYFNNDRNELSQDIFPATDFRNSVQKSDRKKLYSS